MEITKRLYITACITQMYIRLLAAWVNKTVPPAMHGLVKFSINFLLHGLTHHLRVHRTDYRNCSVYTVLNINVLFTQHGLPKVNFNSYRMAITELFHITFRFHCTDYRNCSVSTARNTIVPFTPHGLPNVYFHLHRMEITKSPCHFPFSPHGIQKPLHFQRMEYNCAIYTTWLSKRYLFIYTRDTAWK